MLRKLCIAIALTAISGCGAIDIAAKKTEESWKAYRTAGPANKGNDERIRPVSSSHRTKAEIRAAYGLPVISMGEDYDVYAAVKDLESGRWHVVPTSWLQPPERLLCSMRITYDSGQSVQRKAYAYADIEINSNGDGLHVIDQGPIEDAPCHER